MGSLLLLTCAAVLALHAGLAEAQASPTLGPTDPLPSEICGLDGYNLNTLALADYWNFTVKNKVACIIPSGASENDVSSCVVYFSICKALPPSVCDGISNSSTCEVVILTNTSKHYYSTGDYRGNDDFLPLTEKTVGFTTIQQSSQSVDGCSGTYETIITWDCDDKKVWDHTSTDVGAFVLDTPRDSSTCLLTINLGYNGACYIAPTIAPDICQLDPYNFIDLNNQPYWSATVPNQICHNPDSIGCQILISFCQALSPQLHLECYRASVCQVGMNPNNKPYSYSMGLYTTAKYAENVDGVGGGFHLDVENGSKPEDHRCDTYNGISTKVSLVCNSSAKWTDPDISAFLQATAQDAPNNCQYTITIQYNGACEQVGPTVITGGTSQQSFVGWILIGIFFFAVMVYLLVGAGYEYFVKGVRGVEVIPNYGFWMVFLQYVLEGCKYSFDLITCFQFQGAIKNPLGGPGKASIDYDKI